MLSIPKIGLKWGGVLFRIEKDGRELDNGMGEDARWRLYFRWPSDGIGAVA